MLQPVQTDQWRIALNMGGVIPWLENIGGDLIDPILGLGIAAYADILTLDIVMGTNTFIALRHSNNIPTVTEWLRFENAIRLRDLMLHRPFVVGETLNKFIAIGSAGDLSGGISATGRLWRDIRLTPDLARWRNFYREFSNGGEVAADNNTTYLKLRELKPGERVHLTLMHVARRASTEASIVVADDVAGTNAVVLCTTSNKSFTNVCGAFVAGGTNGKFILLRNTKAGAGAQSATGYVQGIDIDLIPSDRFHHAVNETTANANTQFAVLKQLAATEVAIVDAISVQKGTSTRTAIGAATTAGGANFVPFVDTSGEDRAERYPNGFRVIGSQAAFIVLKNVAPAGGPHPVAGSISGRMI